MRGFTSIGLASCAGLLCFGLFAPAIAGPNLAQRLICQLEASSGSPEPEIGLDDLGLQADGERLLLAGRLAEAQAGFEAARDAALAQNDNARLGAALDGLGLVAAARGRRVLADRLHRQAAEAFVRAGDGLGEARAHYNRGLSTLQGVRSLSWLEAARTGRVPENQEGAALFAVAGEHFQSAGALALAAGDAAFAATAYAASARAQARSPEALGAGPPAQSALEAARLLPDPEERANALLSTLDAALTADLFVDDTRIHRVVEEAMAEAIAATDATSDRELQALARGFAARAYGVAGRQEDARIMSERAAFLAAAGERREASALWLGQAAAYAEVSGAHDLARRRYAEAVAVIVRRRDSLIPDETRAGGAGLQAELMPLLAAQADFLLRRAPVGAGFERSGLVEEARQSIELARSIEIESFVGDPCVRRGISSDLSDLPADAAVLYPVTIGEEAFVILGTREGATLQRSEVSAQALQDAAARLRRAFSPSTLSNDYEADAELLYAGVMAPVEGLLRRNGLSTVLYAPVGALRDAPLAAFLSPEGRFVAQDFAVATVLSLSLIDPTEPAERPYQALAAGISDAVDDFEPLPAVRAELEAVRSSVRSQTLLNERFNRETLEQGLSSDRLNIVHLATHGSFGGNVRQSFVLGHEGPIYLDELNQLVARARIRDAAINLLTLSACETAAGDDRAVMGLAGAAFASGADTVIGALWQVSDESTAQLFGDFYADMAARQASGAPRNKAWSLAEAQRRAIAEGRHPFEWSGFVLIGKWR